MSTGTERMKEVAGTFDERRSVGRQEPTSNGHPVTVEMASGGVFGGGDEYAALLARALALPPSAAAAVDAILADIVASTVPNYFFKPLAEAIHKASGADAILIRKQLLAGRGVSGPMPVDVDEDTLDYEPAADPYPLWALAGSAYSEFCKWVDTDSRHLALAVLWCIGSWGLLPGCTARQFRRHGGVYFYPYLWLTSVDAGSGKTTLLRSFNALARRPLAIGRITPAALFRDLAEVQRSGLVDEVGDLFGSFPEIAGLLEMACYRDGSVKLTELVSKDGRESRVTKEFLTFSAIAMASVERGDRGSIRNTLRSRAIRMRMVPSQSRGFQPLSLEVHARAVCVLAEFLGPHLAAHADEIRMAMEQGPKTPLPAFLKNRGRDVWVHFFAIAELLGGEWPARCLAVCQLLGMPDKSPRQSDARDALDALRACQVERAANYGTVATWLAQSKSNKWDGVEQPYSSRHFAFPHRTTGMGYDPAIPLDFLPTLHFIDWLTTNGGAAFSCANASPKGGPITPKKLSVLLDGVVKTEDYTKRAGAHRVEVKGWTVANLEKVWAEEE